MDPASGLTRLDIDDIHRGAVLPQCLDNQYVPPALFDVLTTSGKAFASGDVHRARAMAMKAEFIRSLVYSPQVVVNRAFLHNNHILHDEFDDLTARRGANPSREAFKDLLHDRAILPYYNDVAGDQRPAYATTDRAAESVAELLHEAESAYVTLPPDRTASLSHAFTEYFKRLEFVSTDDACAMLRELRGGQRVDPAEGTAFREHLRRVAHFAVQHEARHGRFGRNDLYEHYVVEPGTNVADGNYRTGGAFAREFKALVDLRYNTTLPDALDRYALAPGNLPRRTALQDRTTPLAPAAGDAGIHAFAGVNHRILAQTYAELDLTSIDGLTLPDVAEIRRLDVWREFASAQSALLRRDGSGEADIVDRFDAFKDAQLAFMDRLNRWAIQNDREHVTESCLYGLRWVLNVAGYAMRLVPDGDTAADVYEVAESVGIVDALPETVFQPAINLVVDAVDPRAKRRRRDHSRQIGVIHDRRTLDRDEIRALVAEIGGRRSNRVPLAPRGHAGSGQSIRP